MQKRDARDQREITNRSIPKNYGGVKRRNSRIEAGPRGTGTKKLTDAQKIKRAQHMRWLITPQVRRTASHIRYLVERGIIAPFEKESKYHMTEE